MSDIIAVELPKFKDKVMYISASTSETKLETSYTISSSFQGIVRLSPNNHNIYHENPDHQLSAQDEKSQGLIYSDAIKFDNDALSALKSDCDITRRMIIASQSTGYTVNFRISDKDVQFDNLGVIGIAESDTMTVYSTQKNGQKNNKNTCFLLNGQRMPTSASVPTISVDWLTKSLPQQGTEPQNWNPHDYDQRQVKVTGTGDNSHLLYTTLDQNSNRLFKYKKTQSFIRDAVMQSLLDLQTIPTGSVHFVPVTIEQYRELLKQGNRPNQNFKNGVKQHGKCDPIIRDFLLCDGAKYYTKDFPQLAKILWGQHITVWSKTSNAKFIYPENAHTDSTDDSELQPNDYRLQQNEAYKTFRVPDLRHMFIGAVHAKPLKKLIETQAQAHPNQNTQKTGYYFPDNLPDYTQKHKLDDHRHFSAYGTYNANLFSSTAAFHTDMVNNYVTFRNLYNDETDIRLNPITKPRQQENPKTVGTMYLTNHPYAMQGKTHHNGFSYRHVDNPQKGHIGVDSISAHMFASIPFNNAKMDSKQDQLKVLDTTYQSHLNKYCGKSSIQVLSVQEPDDKSTLHGHENAPKFFAMLPLIKI